MDKICNALNGHIHIHDSGIYIKVTKREENLRYDEIEKIDYNKAGENENGILDVYTKNKGNLRLKFGITNNEEFDTAKTCIIDRINSEKMVTKNYDLVKSIPQRASLKNWIFIFIIGIILISIFSNISGNKLNLSKFNQIQTGMSYEEVVKIIGSEGEVVSESDMFGYHTIMYSWSGKGSTGANAIFTFQNNKLNNKAQVGLR